MHYHKTSKESHVFEHNYIPGYEIDFENVQFLDRADRSLKLSYKEMLYIRKLKPSLNKQLESELFTLIIRNVQLENSNLIFYNNLGKKNWRKFFLHFIRL